ncbi:hypothetical protein LPB72_20635 [Hydrogenophaga crassostreae]|uniref:Transmembrane protein n=1 Tax=Hydrogenophaga crassostreae TaxID=1763535 RepID=A0A167GMU7_9BURK|nr:hypothetical protein [Hydrogenophaga crassostreae]AOW14840.1 hypothetical protein LPB072_20465 [Hydrogenophaga crassostreae]OAD39669.1 hypothetical protein LPB72_20635 [Hydrogenophaga crassostreae]
MNRLLRALLWPLKWLLALLILFEEWGWEPLQRWLARVAMWPSLRWLDAAIRRLPPYAALALLGGPALTLLPIKLLALWLIGQGHAVSGLMVILAAKVLGTAVVAHLFALTQPALMRLDWFAWRYTRWTQWKDRLLNQVRASVPWRTARIWRRQALRQWHRWTRP